MKLFVSMKISREEITVEDESSEFWNVTSSHVPFLLLLALFCGVNRTIYSILVIPEEN